MKFYSIALIIFLIIINCKSPTESTYNSNNLTGTVSSESGTPLKDAIIKLTYYLEYGDVSNEANIVYSIPNTQNVKLWITRYNSNDIIVTLVDTTQGPGQHSIIWDKKNDKEEIVINHIYKIHLEAGDNYQSVFLLINDDYDSLNAAYNYEYDAKTDNHGKFTISTEQLPLEYSNEVFKISRYVKVRAYHDNYQKSSLIDSIYVDRNTGANINIKFN